MISFLDSSQKTDWIFPEGGIDSHRSSRLKEFFEISSPSTSIEVLRDENSALRYFARQILIVFGLLGNTPKLKKKWRLAATSAVYFRRFYRVHLLAEHDPRTLMLACIFLASKCEEGFVDLQSLRQHIHSGASNQDILQAEVLLAETLRFDLKVHHPHPLLHSLLASAKRRVGQALPHAQLSQLAARWLERSEHVLHALLTTDAPLLHSPLALACFAFVHTADEEVAQYVDVQQHLHAHLQQLQQQLGAQAAEAQPYALIQGQLDAVRARLEEAEAPFDMRALESYMRRLKRTNRWHTLRSSEEADANAFA